MKVLIIGAGGVGSHLAKMLSQVGHSVTIIDKDEYKVTVLSEEADVESRVGDVTDPRFYQDFDLSEYDVIVSVTDKDEVNVFVAALARVYGVERIYVRVRDVGTMRVLNLIGVTGVVVEPRIIANMLYSMIEGASTPVILASLLTGEYVVAAFTVKRLSSVRGRRLRDLIEAEDLEGKLYPIAVYDGEKFIDPDSAGPLEEGLVVVALVHKDYISEIAKYF